MRPLPLLLLGFAFLSCTSLTVNSAPRQAAIATAHPLATQAGVEVLRHGGNAFDAAVAITAALAVVEPYSSGIGGGGFYLLHQVNGKDIMLDARETAPLKAHRNMYLDGMGEVIPGASINGPLAAGIPGVPAALDHLANLYGKLPLKTSLQPAIRLAQNGFAIEQHYQRMAKFRLDVLHKSPAATEIFLTNGEVPKVGDVIKQPDLARTFQRIAHSGAAGFYRGELAKQLVKGVQQAGGIWSMKDLASYQVKERQPVTGEYRGMKITSVAPPSSGGVALVEMFHILASYDLNKISTAERIHLLVEAMRRAYRDRAEYLGDTDFVKVPMKLLTSKDYAAGLAAGIHPDKATPSDLLPPISVKVEGPHTTHFSVMDFDGNRVSATLSVNYPFGSCFVPPGTGVLLNDEMDDFSSKPGTPNVYGLVGAEANAIAPGKRMLSSMSPSFIETKNRLAAIGTPGGSRIITMVLLGALGFDNGMTADNIVNLPRIHHQYLPDKVFYEPGAINKDTATQLQQMGYTLEQGKNTWGNMQIVILDKTTGKMSAASDQRGLGKAVVIQQEK